MTFLFRLFLAIAALTALSLRAQQPPSLPSTSDEFVDLPPVDPALTSTHQVPGPSLAQSLNPLTHPTDSVLGDIRDPLSIPRAEPPSAPAPPAAPPDSASTESSDRDGIWCVFTVPGAARSLIPLAYETASALGDARSPLATPRAFTALTPALLDDRAPDTLRDLAVYSPGTYVPTGSGLPAVPALRGAPAAFSLNGQRRSDALSSLLTSFNAVESLDVVRGPGSPVFGSGPLTGGDLDLTTKSPNFSGPATIVTARFGSWLPGTRYSFPHASAQIDTTAPISDTLAWRVSYEAAGGDTFYRRAGVWDDRRDLFTALTWRTPAGTSLAFLAQWLSSAAPAPLGVNRLTQDLVWHAHYFTGTSPDYPLAPGPIPATGLVRLPRDATLYSPADYTHARAGTAQLIATFHPSPAATLVDRTLFEHVHRAEYLAVGYASSVASDTFDHRTEAHLELPTLWEFPQALVAGAALRWSHSLAFASRADPSLYAFDLAAPSSTFNAAFPGSSVPGTSGPGGLSFLSPVDPLHPTPATGDSRILDPALFAQDEIRFYHNISLFAGARLDRFSARTTDPLPPPGTIPAADSASATVPSGDASLLFRPTRETTYYLTWQTTGALRVDPRSGGLPLNAAGRLDSRNLRARPLLLELGAKSSLLDRQLFATATLFTQRSSTPTLDDTPRDLRVSGLELEAVYQPGPRLSATANATVQSGQYLATAPVQFGGRSLLDTFAPGRGPGDAGRATATAPLFSDQVPVGHWALVGFSPVLLNTTLRYRFASGFGAGLDAQWQSPQRGNLDGEWHLPSQSTLNASFSYATKTWTAHLDVLNLTDQRNWVHSGDPATANLLLLPGLPLRLQGYIRTKF